VTILPVPAVTEEDTLEPAALASHRPADGLLATAGTEAYALATRANSRPDIRFGTEDGVAEAALRGLDVLLAAVTDQLPRHTAVLREKNVPHEVLDGGI